MRIPRIYLQQHPLQPGDEIDLPASAVRHVVQVLRLGIGASLTVFNGQGGEYSASLIELAKRKARIRVDQFKPTDLESPRHVHLFQGISRGERMDLVLQKATELGVSGVTPLFTERCGVQLKGERLEKRLQHWRGVIIAACEQSGRNRLPDLRAPLSLPAAVEQHPPGLGLMLDPFAEQRLKAQQPADQQTISLFIGPEGGFSETETRLASSHGVRGVILGPRVLRTETAAFAALSVVQCLWGDL